MSRQDDRRLRRVTGRAPIGASGRTGRAGPGEKVAKPRAPSLNGTLPAGYGKTRIVLLPVDPYLVHVYWEVSGSGMGFVRALVEEWAARHGDGLVGAKAALKMIKDGPLPFNLGAGTEHSQLCVVSKMLKTNLGKRFMVAGKVATYVEAGKARGATQYALIEAGRGGEDDDS